MERVIPKLSDVSPTKFCYKAGDRVIARIQSNFSPSQRRVLESCINRYAGVSLNILIVDCRNVNLQLFRGPSSTILADLSYISSQQGNLVSFGCSKVEFLPGDFLSVKCKIHGPRIYQEVKKWAGDIEVAGEFW